MNPYLAVERARLIRTARIRVHAVAHELAEQGLAAETIAAAMADMAETASKEAARFVADFEAREAVAVARDREDVADEMEARRAHDFAEQESA